MTPEPSKPSSVSPRPLGRSVRAAAASLLAALAVPATPASAVPSSTIVAIFRAADCAAAVCDPARDPALPEGATVEGRIQVHVRSSAALGLEWVRLEAHHHDTPPTEWACMQLWRTGPGTFEFSGHHTWDTYRWPDPDTGESACEDNYLHYHGALARNGTYDLRVRARERDPERTVEPDSPHVTVTFRNRPSPPQWIGPPELGGTTSRPTVRLRWRANPEERAIPEPPGDVVEYHFVRRRAGGEAAEFAVAVADPGVQGCQRLVDLYQCTDTPPPGGSYLYGLLALRENGAVRCATTGGRCSESAVSAVHTLAVPGAPGSSPPATPTGTAREPAPSVTASPAPDDVPLTVTPPPDRDEQLTAAGTAAARRSRAVPLAVAAGLATVATIVLLRRFARSP